MIEIQQDEFGLLSDFMLRQFGICLKDEKKTLVNGRLQNILLNGGFKSFSEYLEHVFTDKTGKSLVTLVDRLTTNHTFFMREKDHFEYFQRQVLPWIMKTFPEKDMRLWSAGCSSGEEPYTLAMLVREYLGDKKREWDTGILATDLSTRVLEKAQKAIYSEEAVSLLPKAYLTNYFERVDRESYRICENIRKDVILRRFNLNNVEFPFRRKFHVIFCRNVMIYFNQEAKNELIRKFYDLTEPGGYLFIGHSESLDRDRVGYSLVMPSVYRKPTLRGCYS